MTEDDARAWVRRTFGAEAVERLELFAESVIEASAHQNLIAPSTIPAIWSRHIVDSAQLISLAPGVGAWLDIGSGAGFPGMVVAILRSERTTLVEPRRQRADFLRHCAALLGLEHVDVVNAKVESLAEVADVISARAVASVEKLLQAAARCATRETRWLLPRGGLVENDVAALRRRWRGMFHMKQSLTNPESMILIVDGVEAR